MKSYATPQVVTTSAGSVPAASGKQPVEPNKMSPELSLIAGVGSAVADGTGKNNALLPILTLGAALTLVGLEAQKLTDNIFSSARNIFTSSADATSKAADKTIDEPKSTQKVAGESVSSVDKTNGMLGENGTQVTSKTVWQNGKTDRIDVENPSPGQRSGDIQYHDVNNTKYRLDPSEQKFYDESENLAPKDIQNLLKDKNFQKHIDKGLRILGEDPLFK